MQAFNSRTESPRMFRVDENAQLTLVTGSGF